jgi:hypothetical protein
VIKRWPRSVLPVGIFAEGLKDVPVIIGGGQNTRPRFWLLIDPIDGTRELMYDKRSAYFLAAAAPGSAPHPRLSDSLASVAVELPTSKAGWADIFFWSKGKPVVAIRENLLDGSYQALIARPSAATDLTNAFGSVVAFFPEGKQKAAAIVEAIAREGDPSNHSVQIFDDQYISTGGQMIELLTGRDRFIADLRPLLTPTERSSLYCHPYDLALAPLAKAAGVILCTPEGHTLDAAFGLDPIIAWCGYANDALRKKVEPIIVRHVRNLAPRNRGHKT